MTDHGDPRGRFFEPVQNRGGRCCVGKVSAPVLHNLVRGDADRATQLEALVFTLYFLN